MADVRGTGLQREVLLAFGESGRFAATQSDLGLDESNPKLFN